MAAEGDNIVRFTYTGADGQVIPDVATHILVQARVVRARAFYEHSSIVEVICHEDVEKIEEQAFCGCRSLRRVIMPGIKIVEEFAFYNCHALEHLECDMLEIIGRGAFIRCESLNNINLPSARIVERGAFIACRALMDVKFGSRLERFEGAREEGAFLGIGFYNCKSLERITIPLKDGLITAEPFIGCDNLKQVDLVEGELHETIAALHLQEWRDDMSEEIDSINHILPNASAGSIVFDDDDEEAYPLVDNGQKAQEIRGWIRSVLDKIAHYQVEHQRLLNGTATILERVLPNNDIVMKKVLPFLELPSYSFEVGGDHQDARRLNVELLGIEDSDEEEEQVSRADSSLGDDEEE